MAIARIGPPETLQIDVSDEATGLALIDYVQNLRIEEAKHLLETSDQAVDEICFAVGYEDPGSFDACSSVVGVWRRRNTGVCSNPFIEERRPARVSADRRDRGAFIATIGHAIGRPRPLAPAA